MTEQELFKSRQVWSALFSLDIDGIPDSEQWAYKKIQTIDSSIPVWLLDFYNATSTLDAATAVNDSLGCELRNHPDPLNTNALALGIIYLIWLRTSTDTTWLWEILGRAADVHQFIDSGEWRDFAPMAPNLYGLSETELTDTVFRPLSEYAENCINKYLIKDWAGYLKLHSPRTS